MSGSVTPLPKLFSYIYSLYRGAYKSLARTARKQAYVSVRMAWISLWPCLAGGGNLMTARVSMLLKSRASLTCFLVGLKTYQHPGKLQRAGWDETKDTCQIKYGFRNSVICNWSLLIRSTTSAIRQPHSVCLSALYKQQARIRKDAAEWRTQSLRSFTAKLTEIINGPEDRGIVSLRNTDIHFQDYVISKLKEDGSRFVY